MVDNFILWLANQESHQIKQLKLNVQNTTKETGLVTAASNSRLRTCQNKNLQAVTQLIVHVAEM